MNKDYNKQFEAYKNLRNEIDSLSVKLEREHAGQMVCEKGCDMCCMDYSIFPVEFYSIVNDIKREGVNPKISVTQNKNECIFLNNHACTIYEQRPVICRTHGLPLLFMNENSEWELSACELNFTEFDFGNFTFENTYPQDKFNSKLFLLNKEFIAAFTIKKFSEFDLIPIRELITEF